MQHFTECMCGYGVSLSPDTSSENFRKKSFKYTVMYANPNGQNICNERRCKHFLSPPPETTEGVIESYHVHILFCNSCYSIIAEQNVSTLYQTQTNFSACILPITKNWFLSRYFEGEGEFIPTFSLCRDLVVNVSIRYTRFQMIKICYKVLGENPALFTNMIPKF